MEPQEPSKGKVRERSSKEPWPFITPFRVFWRLPDRVSRKAQDTIAALAWSCKWLPVCQIRINQVPSIGLCSNHEKNVTQFCALESKNGCQMPVCANLSVGSIRILVCSPATKGASQGASVCFNCDKVKTAHFSDGGSPDFRQQRPAAGREDSAGPHGRSADDAGPSRPAHARTGAASRRGRSGACARPTG